MFRFRLFAFTGAANLRPIVLRSSICACAPTTTGSSLTTVCVLFLFFGSSFFWFLPRCLFFSEDFCTIIVFTSYGEYTSNVFPFRLFFSSPVTTGCIFYISLVGENLNNSVKKRKGLRFFCNISLAHLSSSAPRHTFSLWPWKRARRGKRSLVDRVQVTTIKALTRLNYFEVKIDLQCRVLPMIFHRILS